MLVENFCGTKVKTLYYGEEEILGLRSHLLHVNIQHLTSPSHTSQPVGIVECKHHHVVETGLALLHHASLLTEY